MFIGSFLRQYLNLKITLKSSGFWNASLTYSDWNKKLKKLLTTTHSNLSSKRLKQTVFQRQLCTLVIDTYAVKLWSIK